MHAWNRFCGVEGNRFSNEGNEQRCRSCRWSVHMCSEALWPGALQLDALGGSEVQAGARDRRLITRRFGIEQLPYRYSYVWQKPSGTKSLDSLWQTTSAEIGVRLA